MQVKLCICMTTYVHVHCQAMCSRLSSMSASIYIHTCTCARKRISRSSLVRHRHRHRHKYRVTNPKKRQSTADDIRVLVKHTNTKNGICPAVGNTAEGVWGERQKLYTVVRETQRISRILFFVFVPHSVITVTQTG